LLITVKHLRHTAQFALTIVGISLLASVACFGQAPIKTMEVKSTWDGLLGPSSSEQTIVQKNDHFYAGQRRLPDSAVQALLTAVKNSSRSDFGLEGLGVTPTWLSTNAQLALRNYLPSWQYKQSSATQRELFVASFSNYDSVKSMFPKLWIRTDDYPEITVKIWGPDRSDYFLQSVGNFDFIAD
jgi:hypothetical protein